MSAGRAPPACTVAASQNGPPWLEVHETRRQVDHVAANHVVAAPICF